MKYKNCPFCGSKPDKPVNDHARMWVIRCSNYLCACEIWDKNDGHYEKDFLPMIIDKWNTRDDRKPTGASKRVCTGDIAGETATANPPDVKGIQKIGDALIEAEKGQETAAETAYVAGWNKALDEATRYLGAPADVVLILNKLRKP